MAYIARITYGRAYHNTPNYDPPLNGSCSNTIWFVNQKKMQCCACGIWYINTQKKYKHKHIIVDNLSEDFL
jgi:hypothetical protein